MSKTPEPYRITDVRSVILNGKHRKAFTAHRLNSAGTAYDFVGHFTAPFRTLRKDLPAFVVDALADHFTSTEG